MDFLQFFRKKTPPSAQSSESESAGYFAQIAESLASHGEHLRRIENKQKETSLQLEDIDAFLQGDSSETALVDSVTALFDIIADFYYFACAAAADSNSPLLEQARLMRRAAQKAVETAGLEIINSENEPFDFRLHSAESAEEDAALPNGHVLKTLKCGYIYKGEIIRTASVVVNKAGTTSRVDAGNGGDFTGGQKDESWN